MTAVAVCMPTRSDIAGATAWDWALLCKNDVRCYPLVAFGSILPNLRAQLARESIAGGYSHLLFVDSDMRFPADTADRLLRRNRAVVAANCQSRDHSGWTARRDGQRVDSSGRHGVERVDTVGFGVMLIEISVFDRLKTPWFPMPWDDEQQRHVGEDVAFCAQLAEQRISVFVDHDLSQQVKHIASVELGAREER